MSIKGQEHSKIISENEALPFDLNTFDLSDIVDLAKDYSIFKGTCIRNKLQYDERIPIPFSLMPSPFPKQWFAYIKSLQTDLNYLLHKISYSPEFLRSALERVLEADKFTADIFKIYETVLEEGILQPISLGLVRSDYLLDTDSMGNITGIKQVENNTIATSNSAITPNVRDMHAFILKRLGVQDINDKLPENKADVNVAKGIVATWKLYGVTSAVILFVVEDYTINICDQRALEFLIYKFEHRIHVLRRTFTELRDCVHLNEEKCLFIDGKEVALVYYRSGYIPKHYQPQDWKTRLLMERSRAIKCPTAGYHLAGTKNVQFQLTLPGVLEKFLPKGSDPGKIRQVFAKQYCLDMSTEGDKAVALALENPHRYVLKPEREGGGNNVYGEKIREVLGSSESSKARQAYILMEKINPPHVRNCLVRSFRGPTITDIVCELGIYGVILGTEDEVFENCEAGYVVKGKEVGLNEGGIVAGYGVIDSPYLI